MSTDGAAAGRSRGNYMIDGDVNVAKWRRRHARLYSHAARFSSFDLL